MNRRILALVLALAALLLLTACSGSPNSSGGAGPDSSQNVSDGTEGGDAPDAGQPDEPSEPAGTQPAGDPEPPEEPKPDEKPEDAQPADPKPEEAAPADPKPTDPKPTDPKPEDVKPADPAPDAGQPEDQPDSAGTESGSVNLKDFYTAAADKYAMPMGTAELTDEEMIDYIYPGLKDVALKQQALYITMLSLNNGELSIVEVENEADTDTVKAIFENRVKDMADGGAWYPEPTEIWTNQSRVKVYGSYVLLTVGPDCDNIVADFEALVK